MSNEEEENCCKYNANKVFELFVDGPKWRPFNSIMDGLSSNKEAMEMMPANPMALHGQPNGQVRNFFHLIQLYFIIATGVRPKDCKRKQAKSRCCYPCCISYLINNRRMFNAAIDDLAEKPYIPHKSLLQ